MFGRAAFAQLTDQLAGITGRFILSINDTRDSMLACPETTYTVGTGSDQRVGELIVSNLAMG